ncbi:MAG TPA: hypothetical protein VLZ81_10280, partial [Blastocatellia bacterium]|nr:hypothetical protein [Blastocatellia bacterium]
MSFRVTNTYMNNQELSDIGLQQQRLAIAQQQVGNGLRINSPSDDPYGDAAVININTQTAVMNQFAQNATTVNNSLSVADGALNTYQQTLDTASSLLTEGQSTITTQSAKNAIATQLQGMAQTIISIANT